MTDGPQFGLNTFGDRHVDNEGNPSSYAQVIRDVVEQGVLADEVGLDFFGVGEHHRDDFAVSSPETVLAAIAARTRRVHLGSAVTVLSSDDPVRVYQRFATLDAISSGRAEVVLGRGSFTESFPLFGFELADYERLFEEKLDLFARLRDESAVEWQGTVRAPVTGLRVFPTTEGEGGLRTWVGVGGSPESVIRTARHGFGLALAIIGGPSERFAPYADLFRRANEQLGRPQEQIAVHSPGHIAASDAQAREEAWPGYAEMHARIGRERGWPPMTRAQFESEVEHGALYVGSPETVARKIAATLDVVGAQRFDLKYASGPMPHGQLVESIRLYGEEVVPRVRELLDA